ncbi:MAG: type I secretion system permease/ATPase [Betaproteobacteria bacterium]
MIRQNPSATQLQPALESLKPALKQAMLFGLLSNLLSLAPTIYMLEVYDRVVNSRNPGTLLMLTLLVLGMYVLMEIMEWVRSQILHNAGLAFEDKLNVRTFNVVFEANLRRIGGATNQALSDLRSLREFLSSPAITAVMDVPMALLYLFLVFLINPLLGWFSVAGALIQGYLTYLTERSTRAPLIEANRSAVAATNYANSALRNAQVIEAMGMQDGIHKRWLEKQNRLLFMQAVASDNGGGKGATSKFVQNVFSSGQMGLACWLSLTNQLSGGGGMFIVAWILGGKVLAPLVQVISLWKYTVTARDAYQRLDKLLQAIPARETGMALPPPEGALSVEGVVAGAPGTQAAIIRGASFALPAGEALAIIGPSAAGKSTLARLLVGIWPAFSGKIRLDGVDVFSWNKIELGPHIGYLPQGIELFDGTLAENIARFGDIDAAKVEAAARSVGLHETIMALPEGYDSRIGEDGCFLSGGQRQRVGLARAIYGEPRFIVLDEPNSSLDEAGEQALVETLRMLKAGGATLVVITHRTSVLAVADRLLLLRDGQVQAYGPRDEVLANIARANQAAVAAAAPAPLPAAV